MTLTIEQLAAAAGVTSARLRRILRLHTSLGISLASAAIMADLIARLDRLEDELRRLRGDT